MKKRREKLYLAHYQASCTSSITRKSFFSPAVFSYEYDCLKGQFAQNKNSVTDMSFFFFFCWTYKKIFWKMWVTKQLLIPN